MIRPSLSIVVTTLLFALAGCGSGQLIDAEQLANAQVAYDTAMDQIAAGDSEAALTNLDVALKPGAGLSADISVDARVQRAICLARVGRAPESHADLDIAAEGAGDMSAVHAARAFVFKKEGDTAKSKSEMKAARRANRSVKAIKD